MEVGLQGLRVIEIGGVAAAMAGKMLADLGATVVKLEPPDGDAMRRRGPFPPGQAGPECSGLFLALNTNKRSVTLDLATPAGQARLEALARRADVILHHHTPAEAEAYGLTYERLAALQPALVLLSITPFGLTGPYRDIPANDLTLFHGSGWGSITPGASDRPELPPYKPYGQHVWLHAGLHGAMAVLAARLRVDVTGMGEHIDLSAHGVVCGFHEQDLIDLVYVGRETTRHDIRVANPRGFFRCRDGWLFLVAPEQEMWLKLLDILGNPTWGSDARFRDLPSRDANYAALMPLMREAVAPFAVQTLVEACQRRKICCIPAMAPEQLPETPQLQARGFYRPLHHPVAGERRYPGPPWLMREPWWDLRRPAPLLGEANGEWDALLPERGPSPTAPPRGDTDDGSGLPLAGVRVLDFTWVWAGPFAAQQLAHLGADVIKVEHSERPDIARRLPYYPPEMEPGVNRCGYFNQLGQGKRSIAVNLRHPEGIALLKRLAAGSDVCINNFSAGVMDRLGLGADVLQALNPGLVYLSMTGFGETGPMREHINYGPGMVAYSGLSLLSGYDDGIPRELGIAYGDPNGGVHAALAVVAALAGRKPGQRGQVIDMSLTEAMLVTALECWLPTMMGVPRPRPVANRDPQAAPHNCYPTAGHDNWVAIACESEAQWAGLCRAMGTAAPTGDERFADAAGRKTHEDALDAIISAWSAAQEAWALARRLHGEGVPAMPVLYYRDIVQDPHLAARGYLTRLHHPEVGQRTHTGIPWRLRHGHNGVRLPAPLLGQHTDQVLAEVLGLDDAARAALRASGAIE